MHGPLLSIAEVAGILKIEGSKDKSYKYRKTLRLLQSLEQKYGCVLLIKLGGTVKTGRWYVRRSSLEAIFRPNQDEDNHSPQYSMLLRTIEDLRTRVEELESRMDCA